jgi:glycosyltransferase involved in cell wall biosynthesis
MNKTHNPLEGGKKPELSIPLHDVVEDQISIIVVHKDKPEFLNICLQSIAVTSFNNNYEIVVVDNGSGEDSQAFLDDIKDEVKLVRLQKNEYWSSAANKGVKAADKNSKYFIFMHCDVAILNPAWLDLLVNVANNNKSGMVGVDFASYEMGGQKVEFLQEYLCLITRDCWDDCGPWNETLPQVGMSFYMTLKTQSKGYNPQVMKNPICHHYQIFSLDINEYEKLTEDAVAVLPKLLTEIQARPIK